MSTTVEYPQRLEIDTGDRVNAVTFTADGKHLVAGSTQGVRVWRIKDGEQVATMPAKSSIIQCVAASNDGKWIAAGTFKSGVFVWDATTYQRAFLAHEGATGCYVDFSPDSTRLVVADDTATATIWDIAVHKKVRTFGHNWQRVKAVKYSPRGDRIATATIFSRHESVRVWDTNDGRLLADVEVPTNGLVWGNNHLFVQTKDSKIRQINAVTGSTVSEWPIPRIDLYTSQITQLQHGTFIACSANKTVTFWDTATHAQLDPIRHTHDIRSIASSSDSQLLAIVAERKIIVKELFRSVSEPKLDIDAAALVAWEHGRLVNAEALLSTTLPTALENRIHHILACRALVRARLGEWDAALVDANESIKIRQSFIGYVAQCVVLVGKGEKDEGIRVCDTAFQHFHSDYGILLPLVKAVVLSMAGDHLDAISCMDRLMNDALVDPALYVVQVHEAYMHLFCANKYMDSGDHKRAVESLEEARLKLRNRIRQPPLIVSLISGWRFDDLAITIQQRLCEALFAVGRVKEVRGSVLRMVDEAINMTEPVKVWVSDFKRRCCSKLQDLGDSAMNAEQYDEAVSHYTVALSLDPPSPQELLVKRNNAWVGKGAWGDALNDVRGWVRLVLTSGSWKDALAAADGFKLERLIIYCIICEDLEMTGHATDAAACLHQLSSEPVQHIQGGLTIWTRDFKYRWCGKLENLGDSATNAKQYDEAVLQYTAALLLDPASPHDLLVKRSMAHAEMGGWEDALNDANEVIKLDSSSPLGYERKYVALLGMKHDMAIDTFKTMLSKMSESSDPNIRERAQRYVRLEQTREAIRTSIQDVIRDSPLVLINVLSGRLCDKSDRAAAFESTPAFTTLITSMTTHNDHSHIEQEVGEYFRYVTFSHKWEANEPLFEKVMKVLVYDLEASPAHEKLQMFCKLVREAGFNWAWSDTCCINKGDHFALQEALVNMFKWYERAAMTFIFLRGVDRKAKRGALTRNIWNMRAWTLQEYHASKVVRIYTEDWTLYLGLEIYNHKEAPEIISEMEEATGISAQALMALRPGLDDIREKLHLASTRQSTRIEDIAYSLLGIFSLSLPITYGEGDKALGRLLAQALTGSGDVSILAWTGRSNTFNSCLPSSITAFRHPPTSHIPPSLSDTEMASITTRLRSLNVASLTMLYDRVDALPVPLFSGRRMKLPCLVFEVRRVLVSENGSRRVFRAQTNALGIVEIQTQEDLSRLDSLCLVHPWIDFLLDRQPIGNFVNIDESSVLGELPSFPGPSNISQTARPTRTARFLSRIGRPFGGRSTPDTASLLPPPTLSPADRRMRVFRFIARLRQPFGALLLTPTRRNVDEYRRVAAESLITVQVEELTPEILDKLIGGVRTLDVL